MVSQTQYLERHGNQWRVRVKVPEALRHVFSKSKLTHPLHTTDLDSANELKWPIVARFKGEIAEAKRAVARGDNLFLEAKKFHRDPDRAVKLQAKMEHVEQAHGWQAARNFVEVATGVSTRIDEELESYLEYRKDYRPKTADDTRRVAKWLDDWLLETGSSRFVEDVSKQVATRFIIEKLSRGRGQKKAIAYLGFLKGYWEHLVSTGCIEENVWSGQKIPSEARQAYDEEPDKGKRAFTDEELVTLLNSNPPRFLPDLILLAALSGMRIEEICRLKVRDCTDGVFKVHIGKTDSSAREVPIHKDLLPIVSRRSSEKAQGDYLIEDLPKPNKKTDVRSSPASKAFTRYRRSCGLDERPNGKSKSNIDFHSLRRWFSKKAKDGLSSPKVSYTPWTIAEILGHDDNDLKVLQLTMKHYPGDSSALAKVACVNAVRLPKDIKKDARRYPSKIFRRKTRGI